MAYQFAHKGLKVFVYRNGSMTPCLTFEKSAARGIYEGYGHQFHSFDRIVKFVERNGDALIAKASA